MELRLPARDLCSPLLPGEPQAFPEFQPPSGGVTGFSGSSPSTSGVEEFSPSVSPSGLDEGSLSSSPSGGVTGLFSSGFGVVSGELLPPSMLSQPEPVVPETGASMMEEVLWIVGSDGSAAKAVMGADVTAIRAAMRSARIRLGILDLFFKNFSPLV